MTQEPSTVPSVPNRNLGMSRRNLILVSLALFLAAFVPRFVIMFKTTPVYPDQYWEISQSLLDNFAYRVKPIATNTSRFFDPNHATALRPPTTPLYIAFLRFATGDNLKAIELLTAVLGSSVAVALFFMARKLGDEKAGILAGLMYAFYPPYLIITVRTYMSEPIALYCLAAMIWMALDVRPSLRKSLLLGIVMGLGILNRSDCLNTALLMSVCMVGLMGYPVKRLAVSWLVCLSLMTPWVVRNWLAFGAPVFTTHSGYVLWQGNSPWTHGTFDNDIDDWGFNRAVEDAPQLAFVRERYPDLWEVDELTRSNYFKAVTKDYVLDLARNDQGRLFGLYAGKLLYVLLQPGELCPFEFQKYHWNPSVGTFTAFLSRFLLKLLCIYFLFARKTTASELLLLVPIVAASVSQLIAITLPRYEVPYFFGCILFVAIKLRQTWTDRRNPVPHAGVDSIEVADDDR